MAARGSLGLRKPLLAVLAVLALGAAGWGFLQLQRRTALPESYRLELDRQLAVDPSLIRFRQAAVLRVSLKEVHAIAVGPEDRIYVAGDRAVEVLGPDGQRLSGFPLAGKPRCLAVGGEEHALPGRAYVGEETRVEVFDAEGKPVAAWESFGTRAFLTSISLGEEEVFAADAGNREVLRFDVNGKLVGRIRGSPGFVIPSAYFDVLAGPDGLVHIVNPGARRIETYTAAGEPEGAWGKSGSDVSTFFGCCNPSHLARLPDGRFVTSEKGIPRVKVYGREGEFECLVAGAEQLGIRQAAVGDPRSAEAAGGYDIATDRQGRILVLDRTIPGVRVFVARETVPETRANLPAEEKGV